MAPCDRGLSWSRVFTVQYNSSSAPEKYRFFFPPADIDFFLTTNVGQIKTHITTSGYFTKGVRSWVEVNGPLEPTDRIHVFLLDENRKIYEMNVVSGEKNNSNN